LPMVSAVIPVESEMKNTVLSIRRPLVGGFAPTLAQAPIDCLRTA
jgi:hypothetical protein